MRGAASLLEIRRDTGGGGGGRRGGGPGGRPWGVATLWGIPASLLTRTIWKSVLAGTSRASLSKATPEAVRVRVTAAGTPGLPGGAGGGAPGGARARAGRRGPAPAVLWDAPILPTAADSRRRAPPGADAHDEDDGHEVARRHEQ